MAKKRKSRRARQQQQKTWMWIGIIVISVSILGGIAWITQGTQESVPAEISAQEAYQKYQEGAFVLDVRTQEEWDEYHAPNTTLIPLDELPQRVNEVPKEQEIVVICRSGNRSQVGREILLEAGFENVTSSAGGLKAWSAAGYPIEGQAP